MVALVAPGAASATSTWSKNLYVARAFMYQDPYANACTAAATMIMLNTIAAAGSGGDAFAWTPSRVKLDPDPANLRDMLSILTFERANDTLRSASTGSDPHGWRNALNAFGWGTAAMTDPAKRVYDDREYRTFGGAVRAAVKSIARYSMPVGILGWAGGHAQVMTGYVVTGADPRVSDAFTVQAVYLSDPLHQNRTVNRKISVTALRSGAAADPVPGLPRDRQPVRRPVDGRHHAELGGTGARTVRVVPPLGDHPADPGRRRPRSTRRRARRRPDPTPTPSPTSSQDPTPTPPTQADAIPSPSDTPTPAPTEAPTPAPTDTPARPKTPPPTETPPRRSQPPPAPDPTPIAGSGRHGTVRIAGGIGRALTGADRGIRVLRDPGLSAGRTVVIGR